MPRETVYSREGMNKELAKRYRWPDWRAAQATYTALIYLLNSEPIKDGIADIVYHPKQKIYTLTERV